MMCSQSHKRRTMIGKDIVGTLGASEKEKLKHPAFYYLGNKDNQVALVLTLLGSALTVGPG